MMKRTLLILLAIFVIIKAESLTLTGANFDETIQNNDFVLNMFYAPWCGHCKTLKPQFDVAADQVQGKYVISKVDCTVDSELCGKFEIKGYPTLIFFKNGNKKEYDGPRSAEGIVSWLDKHSGPVAKKIESSADLEEFLKKDPVAIGFFKSEDSEGYKNFIEAAEDQKTQEISFAYVTDSALFGDDKDGDVELHLKDGKEVDVPAEQLESAKVLASYLFDQTFPLVGEIGPENFKNYVSREKPLYLTFLKFEDPSKDGYVEILEKVAVKYPAFSFGYISEEKFGGNMERMGASGKVVPAIVRLTFNENKPISYEREGEFNEEAINEWIEGIASGKYKYKLKSQPEPETQEEVKILVGTNFDSIVHDETKDVLVEFYAPWCGHCKSLVPEYEKLANAFKDVDDIVIAKIDLTANDVETIHHEVKGFPTILLYKRDDKTHPLTFQGPRTAQELASWVKENTKSESAKDIKHDEL